MAKPKSTNEANEIKLNFRSNSKLNIYFTISHLSSQRHGARPGAINFVKKIKHKKAKLLLLFGHKLFHHQMERQSHTSTPALC